MPLIEYQAHFFGQLFQRKRFLQKIALDVDYFVIHDRLPGIA